MTPTPVCNVWITRFAEFVLQHQIVWADVILVGFLTFSFTFIVAFALGRWSSEISQPPKWPE